MPSPRRHTRRDVFRYTPFFRAAVLVTFLGLFAGLVVEYRAPNHGLAFYGFLGLSVFGIVAVVGAFRGRIELRADEIRVIQIIGHRSYLRSRVLEARWAAGCPVSLKL